jgi:prolyl-tRNA editing enzyme YbaK/EbsC (Cys-tRNA(Pro) deacylase)
MTRRWCGVFPVMCPSGGPGVGLAPASWPDQKPVRVLSALDAKHVSYDVIPHRHTETVAAEARAIGIDPAQVAKTLVLVTEGGFVRAVLPANECIDLEKVRQALDGENVQLATEQVLAGAYPDFELGAVPPLGALPATACSWTYASRTRRRRYSKQAPTSRTAIGGVEVVGHLLEARYRLGRELCAQGDDERVVREIACAGPHDPCVEVELPHLCLAEFDALPLKTVQGTPELLLAAVSHHLPEQRRLVRRQLQAEDSAKVARIVSEAAENDHVSCAKAAGDGAAVALQGAPLRALLGGAVQVSGVL